MVSLLPELPGTFLMGSPDGVALARVLSRFLLMVVRTGATAALMDVCGLENIEDAGIRGAFDEFFQNKRVQELKISVVAHKQDFPFFENVAREAGLELHLFGYFNDAMQAAFTDSGFRVVRLMES